MIGVVLGSSATGPRAELAESVAELGAVAIQRHRGGDGYVLPHRIDHAANVEALLEANCTAAIAICSVGSLREGLPVGSLICPDDFVALADTTTALGDARAHIAPGFDQPLREALLGAAPEEVVDGGTYWQANGPRFETPAEIRMIAPHAHVVGMTMASECVVACELGLPYAALCAVDNLANGIGPGALSVEAMEAVRDENAVRLRAALEAILPAIAAALGDREPGR